MSKLYDFPEETLCQRFVKDMLGSWTTESGNGTFPTMMPFRFGADFNVSKVPVKTKAAFVHTSFHSWPPGKKREIGMHYENGFFRCTGDRTLEFNITHNFGMTEVVKGTVSEDTNKGTRTAVLDSTHIGNAQHVKQTRRILEVSPKSGLLSDHFYMATDEVPELTEHLKVSYLKRSSPK